MGLRFTLPVAIVMLISLFGCRDSDDAATREKLDERFDGLAAAKDDGGARAGAYREEYIALCRSIDSNVEQGKVMLMHRLRSGSDAERSLALTLLADLSQGGELYRARNFTAEDFAYFHDVALELAKSQSSCSRDATQFLLNRSFFRVVSPEFEAFLLLLVRTGKNPVFRGQAYVKLAHSQTEASWGALIHGLNEKEFAAYLGCLRGLVARGDSRAVGPLVAELSKPPREERFSAELAPGNITAENNSKADTATRAKMRSYFQSESRVYTIERCLKEILGPEAPSGCDKKDFDWAGWYSNRKSGS